MSLIQYEPWSLFDRFFNASTLLNGATAAPPAGFIPPVDIHEEADRFVVLADLPGLKLEDIEVTADKGVLTVRGERKQEKREKTTGYERIERVAGSFTRRFQLPENVVADEIKARYTNGVLEVTIPKQPVQQARRVTVETH